MRGDLARALNRGGRPTKPDNQRCTELIQFRVTKDEFDAICKAAFRRGEKLGQYLLRVSGFRIDETPKGFHDASDSATVRGR